MLKRLMLLGTVVVFSSLSAESPILDNSFSFQFSKSLNIEGCCTTTDTENSKFSSQIAIAAVAQQDGLDFNDLIFNTITSLVNKIDPDVAANIYLALVKKQFDALVNNSNLEILTSSKNEEELKQNLNTFLKKLFDSLSSKETQLKQAICFAIFTDEVVKEITQTIATCAQDYVIKMNALTCNNCTAAGAGPSSSDYSAETCQPSQPDEACQGDACQVSTCQTGTNTGDAKSSGDSCQGCSQADDYEVDTDTNAEIAAQIAKINQLLIDYSKKVVSSIVLVLENNGYKIDHQGLGL